MYLQLYKQHFASEGGDDDEDEGDIADGEGITDQLAPSANKKRLVRRVSPVNDALPAHLGAALLLGPFRSFVHTASQQSSSSCLGDAPIFLMRSA